MTNMPLLGHQATINASYGTKYVALDGTEQTTESVAKVPFPAGTLKSLKINVISNTMDALGLFTVTIRKNGANTALTLNIGESDLGLFTIDTDVSVAENDFIDVALIEAFTSGGVSVMVAFSFL